MSRTPRPERMMPSTENRALMRVRAGIEKGTHSRQRVVEDMLDFLWRQSSSYSYSTYGYWETDHASRVLYRWLRVFGKVS